MAMTAEVGQADATHTGWKSPSTCVVCGYFSTCISRDLDSKWNSKDSNHTCMGCWVAGGGLTQPQGWLLLFLFVWEAVRDTHKDSSKRAPVCYFAPPMACTGWDEVSQEPTSQASSVICTQEPSFWSITVVVQGLCFQGAEVRNPRSLWSPSSLLWDSDILTSVLPTRLSAYHFIIVLMVAFAKQKFIFAKIQCISLPAVLWCHGKKKKKTLHNSRL